MNQIAPTNGERIEVLEGLGYTPREAAFLCLAALHGGYFLRRQYCCFLGKAVGGTAAALVEKLLRNGHATAAVGCQNTKVYHLGSRPFYAALGQEDNRNRRHRPPVAIRNKLMGLDYVLDRPEREYLATEQEKVDYFTQELGVPLTELPTKEFRSPTAPLATPHYFVDKYPIAFPSEVSPVSFCFIDEGIASASRFESHLKRYALLFARLSRFELAYVAASEAPFGVASRCFEAFFGPRGRVGAGGLSPSDADRLVSHFRDRGEYEAGRLQSFDRSRLLRFRDNRREFSGLAFDRLYEIWKAGGEDAIRQSLTAHRPSSKPPSAQFLTHVLRHNYDVFGTRWRPHEDR